MNRTSRIAAVLAVATLGGPALPASAQYANEFSPAHIVKQGSSQHACTGSGVVVLQVDVKADGSHTVSRVLRTTNQADVDAAKDIAQSSTYAPAHRGTTPIRAFYDYTLRFKAGSCSASTGEFGGGGTGADAQIRRMLGANNYHGAKQLATTTVAGNSSDNLARQYLGIADYYLNDLSGSAAAFAQVDTILPAYKALAAHALAAAAAQSASNPNEAQNGVTYGQKAVELDRSANSYYGLGAAQLGAKQASAAVASLKQARSLAFAGSSTKVTDKVNIDTLLAQAQVQAGDSAGSQTTLAEIKQLDPHSSVAARLQGNSYISAGNAAMNNKQYDEAVKQYDLAAQSGDASVQVTAYGEAAFALANTSKPDYTKVKSYADKALAVKADDPMANWAEGLAYTGIWATVSHKDSDKQSAQSYCTKAAQYARAQGNEQLALQIEKFQKDNIK